jgi:two-component system CheB/CheR fusion protein
MSVPEDADSDHSARDDGLPPVDPDFAEQDDFAPLDNIVPTRGFHTVPMVGLGGSAGSIPALVEFFKAMPPDSGMAFVVVLHLSPSHESTLTEVLARATSMRVVQAEDEHKVVPDRVYVIPPGKYLVTVNGHLRLSDLVHERGKRVAVDLFFRSLADTHGPHAFAVILSGADADGALGIKRIKERGGLTIAQDPEQASHQGMPRSAIETGMIDWVMEVGRIPARLIEYRAAAQRLKLPPEDGPQPQMAPRPEPEKDEEALRDVLAYLRIRTGRDFSYYKRATILRRIARRMQVNGIDELPAYLELLRMHPGEAGALLQDLLISVTNFFRDRDAFAELEQQLPALFEHKSQTDTVRVWVPACATGEEAYSIAILLLEHARRIDGNTPTLQVFASDLDDDAIQRARAGQYPDTIAADVSEDRLRRFFVRDQRGFRVRRELREMVLFATHDLLKDAPFSRMDLISCRNLLIYLNRDAQRRALDIFHFALKAGGRLFLGTSEAVDDGSPLFDVLSKKYRIFQRVAATRVGLPVPSGPSTVMRVSEAPDEALAPVVHGKSFVHDFANGFQDRLGATLDRSALAELHFRLVERLAPPSVIVDSNHEIVHLSEHVGEFLKFAGGQPSVDLLRVVHPALRVELRAALFRANEAKGPVESFDVPIDLDGREWLVDVRVAQAFEVAPGHLLVSFDKHEPQHAPGEKLRTSSSRETPVTIEPVVRHLERELEKVKLHLRDTVEQYEASTEELKASNEELQAMNEELRSATEELETSREELQSINEELTTVNQEMKGRVDELGHANSDLQNLMASTAIATVFLNRELAIKRYTPSAASIFNLIPGDVGRPLEHLKHRLDYPELMADAEQVLRTLAPVEREIAGTDRVYLVRIQPYRTLEDHIGGAVVTLIDVTERNRASEALRLSEERMRLVVESASEYAIFTTDMQRRVDSWNSGAQTMFGYAEKEILGQPADVLFTPEDRANGDAEEEMQTALREGRAQNERWHSRKDGSVFYGSGAVMLLRDANGVARGFVKIMRDLTESKRTQEALRDYMNELKRFNDAAVGRETRMIELKEEVNALLSRAGEAPRYVIHDEEDKEGGGP